MNARVEFDAPVGEAMTLDRITQFLALAGFVPDSKKPMQFRRGSYGGSTFSTSILKVPTTAFVRLTPREADATHAVIEYEALSAAGLVTDSDRAVWAAELRNLERAAVTGYIANDGVAQATTVARRSTWLSVLVLLVVALGVGFGAIIIGEAILGRPIPTWLGITVGLAVAYAVQQRLFGGRRAG
jgi:hypothetical protein